MAYGLFQGLNQAYQSFRQREADIEAQADKEAEREYRDTVRAREAEEYEYGLSRRKIEEEAADLQLQSARNEVRLQNEQFTPEAVKARKEAIDAQSKMLKMQIEEAGYKVNTAKLNNQAATAREKYNAWTREWQMGMSVEDLVAKFNTDEDQTNNIAPGGVVRDPETGGWNVTFMNGSEMKFEDRDAVGRHLQNMADPEFYQTWLLQQQKGNIELAKKLAAAEKKADETMYKRKQDFGKEVRSETDRVYGKLFPNGLVDFGEPGNKELASNIRSIANQIGAGFGYDVIPSEVVDTLARFAMRDIDTNPETRRQRALEIFEKMPDADFPPDRYPDGKPDADEPGGEAILKNIMFEQARDDINALKLTAFQHYHVNKPDGTWVPRTDRLGGDQPAPDVPEEKITREGLERPGTPAPEAPEAEATEGMGLRPQKRDVPPVDRETRDAVTIRLEPKSFVRKKTAEYGIKSRAGKPIRVSREAKQKITKDFDLTFDSMSKGQQGAWFKAFGKHLDEGRKKLAEAKITGKTDVAQR